MLWCVAVWRDHSLTVALTIIGSILFTIALPLGEGRWFDFWLGLGHGCWTATLLNVLAGRLRERNRPEA